MRQLLIQSLVLSAAGGLLGVVVAIWGIEFLSKLIPESLSQLQAVALNGRVLLFASAVSLLTGLIFGTVPAIQSSHTKLGDTLSKTSRDMAGGVRGRRVRRILVIWK
jgi:ABC-type antimicrobial peptide transport system permease subunit